MDSVVSSVIGSLVTLARDNIVSFLQVGEEVGMLQQRLGRILPVLDDADTRKLEDAVIHAWCRQLRDILDDVEDIIDEFHIQAEYNKKSRMQQSSAVAARWYSQLSHICSRGVRRHQIGEKIKTLNKKLEAIIVDIPILRLRQTPAVDHDRTRNTSPLVEPQLVGDRIEKDTRMLVEKLLSKEHQRQPNVCVFAIVGMAGIGKTTLAQKIHNDHKLKAKFHIIRPIWVSVSHVYSDVDLLRTIISRAQGKSCKANDVGDLLIRLSQIVNGKKIFLVLDDVWNARVWTELLNRPLQNCLAGSKVLLTTRDESVASSMGAVICHRVERLSDEAGWLLLSKMVLLNERSPGNLHLTLRDIGMRIVEKCDGVPLAIKVVAGVLQKKARRQQEWENVLRDPAWSSSDATGALYLSYVYLPPYLKQCFLYFALFSEDEVHELDIMTRLWIAEGFIKAETGVLMEDSAKGYWRELIQRSILEPDGDLYDSRSCRMQGMLHSLARRLASDECFYWDMEDESNDPPLAFSSQLVKPRHVNFRGEVIPDAIRRHVSLRTLLSPHLTSFSKVDVTHLRYLRVLNIEGAPVERLSSSIGDLIHLRYLNLSESTINQLPERIGDLTNLLFLGLRDCKNLHSIPNSIVNLSNLRSLDLLKTELYSMPENVGKLKNLNDISGFLVSNFNLKELGGLSQLRTLIAHELQNVRTWREARKAKLREKHHLLKLELCCTDRSSYDQRRRRQIAEVFEELCPPPCLEELVIKEYFGRKYPSWMVEERPLSTLTNLRRVELINCFRCEQLPPLGLLTQLDYLHIEGASAVKIVGPELFNVGRRIDARGSSSATYPHPLFPKLEVLVFKSMSEWKEWNWSSEDLEGRSSSSQEEDADYDDCEERNFSTGEEDDYEEPEHRSSSSREEDDCDDREERSLPHAENDDYDEQSVEGRDWKDRRSLSSEEEVDYEDREDSWSFSSEKENENEDQSNFSSEEEDDGEEQTPLLSIMPCLRGIDIEDCPKLRSLPDGLLRYATCLKKLSIEYANRLTEVKNLPHLESLTLDHTYNLERLSNLPSLETLELKSCRRLKDVEALDALQRLFIIDSKMDHFPEWLFAGGGGRRLQFPELDELEMEGTIDLLYRCLDTGRYSHIIKKIPHFQACDRHERHYVEYTKSTEFFSTNLSRGRRY